MRVRSVRLRMLKLLAAKTLRTDGEFGRWRGPLSSLSPRRRGRRAGDVEDPARPPPVAGPERGPERGRGRGTGQRGRGASTVWLTKGGRVGDSGTDVAE